jgi:hypothetical protein
MTANVDGFKNVKENHWLRNYFGSYAAKGGPVPNPYQWKQGFSKLNVTVIILKCQSHFHQKPFRKQLLGRMKQ